MPPPWTTYAGLTPPECVTCCTPTPVAQCQCALLIPSQLEGRSPTSVYADYDAAAARIANQSSNCIGFGEDGDRNALATFVATFTSGVLAFSMVATIGYNSGVSGYSTVSLKAGTLSVVFSGAVSSLGFNIIILRDCFTGDAIFIASGGEGVSSGTFSVPDIPEGTYVLECVCQGPDVGSTTSAVFSITHSDVMVVSPVVAVWDDGGTPRQLDACPKLCIPPNSTGTQEMYADLTAAEDALANQVSNCIGFIEQDDFDSFSATGALTLAAETSLPLGGVAMWGSLNLENGSTLTSTFSISNSGGGSVAVQAKLFDYAGNLVETLNSTAASGTLVFSPVTFKGRYNVRVAGVGTAPGTLSVSHALTSDDTLTVNEVQALYDVEVACPERIDCS